MQAPSRSSSYTEYTEHENGQIATCKRKVCPAHRISKTLNKLPPPPRAAGGLTQIAKGRTPSKSAVLVRTSALVAVPLAVLSSSGHPWLRLEGETDGLRASGGERV